MKRVAVGIKFELIFSLELCSVFVLNNHFIPVMLNFCNLGMRN